MPLDTPKTELTEIGAYDVLSRIAEGGMGTVYKARRRQDGLIVAIKVIPPLAARNAVLLQRFKREFNAARQIEHKNVVKALEFCESPPSPYLVMEYVDGESLGQRIERVGKIPVDEAIRIIAQTSRGLYEAHKQGMIHRDVKPDNILLAPDGMAKITDLGLVKDIEGEMNLTRTGRGLGTPHFMAPEQFRNAKNADVRCDVYSLGATLYMAVTGKLPFDGCGPLDAWMKKSSNEFPAPRDIDPAIPERVDWAIRRAMHANPDMRPASCREFVEDLLGQSSKASHAATAQPGDLWYMVYRDDDGAQHTVKGTTENIRRAYRDHLLGDAGNIRACRTKQGPFQALNSFAEFRDLVIDPEHQSALIVTPSGPMTGARRASPASSVPTPPTGGRENETVEYDAISGHSGPTSGKWASASGRHASPNRSRTPGSPRAHAEPAVSAASGTNMLLWLAVVVLAIGLGVVTVLLLR